MFLGESGRKTLELSYLRIRGISQPALSMEWEATPIVFTLRCGGSQSEFIEQGKVDKLILIKAYIFYG